jgi:DNA polymerase I
MSDTPKKLFLLDAFALIYRAHFAFIKNPRINSKGMNTSAVFGFCNSLLDILNNEKPSHIGIVYDTDKPTFRHTQFTEYKAGRQEQPEDIAIAIPYIIRLAEAMGIPNLMLDGFEADDVIGTLAKKASANGYQVFMMTPDKDFGQLVEENLFQYRPAYMGNKAEKLGVKEIKERWEVEDVCQVIDILGLMGDSVDNIPGVPGVGEKTAKKLIKEWGSIENLLANKDKIPGKLGENIRQFADQAIMSKELATIDLKVPIDFDEHELRIDPPNTGLLRILFDDLEFRQMAARFFGEETTVQKTVITAKQTVQRGLFDIEEVTTNVEVVEEISISGETRQLETILDIVHDYQLVTGVEECKKLAAYLSGFTSICFDTETTGIDPHTCNIVGFSFSVKPGEAYYVGAPGSREEDGELLNVFKDIFENEDIEIIGQNIKFDIEVLKNYGIELKGPLYDTMLAHYLIEPDTRHGMDLLANKYLNYKPVSITELIGKRGKDQISMADLTPEQIKDYACEDADVTLKLKNILHPIVIENNADKLLKEVELPLIYVLADMECEGIRLDVAALNNYSIELKGDIEKLEQSVYEMAGIKFNINSPAQLGEVLFEKMRLDDKAKRTSKTKQYSTGEEVLSLLAAKHDIARTILDYRSLQKLKSTYVDSLPLLINKKTGRIHTSYNQAVAATGRLSSTDPNLQNIPIRTEKGREIRKAFIARDENHSLLSADYSQIELRLIAEISNEENMIKAFQEKQDIHTATAAKIYNIPVEGVTPEMRRRAKMVNFGIIYGISAFGLSQRLNISRNEAGEIIRQYNTQYPRINEYLHNMIDYAHRHGYVETLLGRRRYLRDINSANATQRGFAERNAINAPIQGTAADMIKVAMINIHKELKQRNLKTKMLLQVHDELVFDVYKPELDEVKEMVEDKMKNALNLKIPIEVETGFGENWLAAH